MFSFFLSGSIILLSLLGKSKCLHTTLVDFSSSNKVAKSSSDTVCIAICKLPIRVRFHDIAINNAHQIMIALWQSCIINRKIDIISQLYFLLNSRFVGHSLFIHTSRCFGMVFQECYQRTVQYSSTVWPQKKTI